MKFNSFLISFILLSLISIIVTTKLQIKKSLKSSDTTKLKKLMLFCESGIKLYIENGKPRGLNKMRDCSEIQFSEYDNDANISLEACNKKSLKYKKDELTNRKPTTKLKKYPYYLFWKILKFSNCKNKLKLIQEAYKDKACFRT